MIRHIFTQEWNVFKAKWFNKHPILVEELEDKWIFYALVEGIVIRSILSKSENPMQNIQMNASLGNSANVSRILSEESEEGSPLLEDPAKQLDPEDRVVEDDE